MHPIKLFDRLALWKKFVCLGLLCLAVIILPTLFYWNEVRKVIAFTTLEQQGLQPSLLMLNIIQRTQQHRGLSASFLENPNIAKKDRRAKAEELEENIVIYEEFLSKKNKQSLSDALNQITESWHQISQKITQREISADQSFQLHTVLIRQQLNDLQEIIDTYQLSFDSEANGYFLISASLMDLPEMTEVLAQLRGLGLGLLTKGEANFAERAQIKSLLLLSKGKADDLDADINKAVIANKLRREVILNNYHVVREQYQKITTLVQEEILSKEHLTYKPEDFYINCTFAINSYFNYVGFISTQINEVLLERIENKKHTMYGLLSYIVVITCLVAFICIRFVRKLLMQLGGEPGYATSVVQAITRGDLAQDIATTHPHSLLANMKVMQEKLKENERIKNEFISTVSHELRTPLTAISGALAVSLSGKLGDIPTAADGLLNIAHKNSLRLTELINDLLDIDKLIAGQLLLDMKTQLLQPVVEESIASMTAYAEKYNVSLVMNPNPEPVFVNADARRLQQVIVNLLSNACKFSRAGERIDINVSVKEGSVRVEVVDYGEGIPEEFQDRLFQKFSQADSSATRKVGGTGLGLAISRELILRMNGEIGFISAYAVGSCFFFELPVIQPTVMAVKNPPNE